MRNIILATICAASLATSANAEQRTTVAGLVNGAVELCRQEAIAEGKFAAKTEAPLIDACMAREKFKLRPECEEGERDGSCYSRSFWSSLGF
ncbi:MULTISPECIES: hypothetical protein [Agrobacterium]|uniref:hypothetical protein n=1 Tax=Agrobacterium TaxID=357 RepID=UPI0022B830DB|nr:MULTISPECIES: hypothetical protein [Agrobacterium]MCZ7885997.1 hypothetical protein [Agrobacterium salinitolerans]MDA5628015.1 hypothetical protein [Agrobacterium sp. ST15.16.055]MDA6978239.1 hypothetical protein [Agrobacterium salinitolerans]